MAEKILKKAYLVVFAALMGLAVLYAIIYRLDIKDAGADRYFMRAQIQERSYKTTDNENIVFVHVDDVSGENCHLIFYSVHQNVTVFWGADRIYSMRASQSNAFTKTPGCVWNDILLTDEMNGEDLEITLTPVYKGMNFPVPVFFIGERGSIYLAAIGHEFFGIVMSILLITLGLALVAYAIYNRNNAEVDNNMKWLGIFAVCCGLWKISDCSAMRLLFHGLPIFSLVPFIALVMGAIPFLLYISELHSTKDDIRWMIPCGLSIGTIYLSLFLQYFNFVDMRQMLVWYWIVMGTSIAFLIYMVILEYRRNGLEKKLRKNLFGMLLIVLGFIGDLTAYFIFGGLHTPGLVILGFILFIISHGITLFRESRSLIAEGEGVQKMEDLAFHDKLTGLLNRAAFITDTDPYAVDPEKYAVVVMDLNDLKKCNDTLGHEVGDRYIRDSARIIQATFGSIGNCYRMGGDEFYCLVPEGGRSACREQEKAMEKLIEEYNAGSPDLKISIACGYARFDNRMDYDLNATAKRADKLMYQRKEEMKGHRAPSGNGGN